MTKAGQRGFVCVLPRPVSTESNAYQEALEGMIDYLEVTLLGACDVIQVEQVAYQTIKRMQALMADIQREEAETGIQFVSADVLRRASIYVDSCETMQNWTH